MLGIIREFRASNLIKAKHFSRRKGREPCEWRRLLSGIVDLLGLSGQIQQEGALKDGAQTETELCNVTLTGLKYNIIFVSPQIGYSGL